MSKTEEKLPLFFSLILHSCSQIDHSIHIYTYAVPIGLVNNCAEAPQLHQLLFGIGCAQHTGDKFRLGLRGTSGSRAAPLEVWEHLLTELHRLFLGQQKCYPGCPRTSCPADTHVSCNGRMLGGAAALSRPHWYLPCQKKPFLPL